MLIVKLLCLLHLQWGFVLLHLVYLTDWFLTITYSIPNVYVLLQRNEKQSSGITLHVKIWFSEYYAIYLSVFYKMKLYGHISLVNQLDS